jgi:hypothetical protein
MKGAAEAMAKIKSRPCEMCKTMIPVFRIKRVPDTRLCVECSKKVGREFDLVITHEVLSKAGSLKKNYGSFEVKKVRRSLKRPGP